MRFANDRLRKMRTDLRKSHECVMQDLTLAGHRLSRQSLVNWESGKVVPEMKNVMILAEYFNKPVTYFFLS